MSRPLRRILIANRGEIACRIVRTARRLGIETVAVHSEADRDALHVRAADAAFEIGPAPSAQSYLAIDRILDALRRSGADAVHPGYGFLSENAGFAEAVERAGAVFIGPPAGAIRAMGDKIASKRFAAQVGVSTVPGHMDLIADADEAARIAARIGYPVMIKASAGGGGKGMRVARDEREAREGFDAARGEARSAFADERVFIEKFIETPRHIEIQVLGDRHGNLIHLGERECSIQRRNQKVVEEAPSPFLDAEMRRAMGEQALALARAVGYHSAGTVEFVVDRDRRFHFLEMNTRLQVEHPVTELVTGVDLVEEMIRVAAGERLRLSQADVRLDGWAIESRVYAEDPYRNFLPSIGRLTRYRPPAEGTTPDGATIRVDAGVFEGADIPVFYDPMIAKLCTHAPTRLGAADAMARALDAFELEGVGHNLPFLAALMGQARFRAGQLTTAYIAEAFPDGFAGAAPDGAAAETFAAVALFCELTRIERDAQISGALDGHRRRPGADWSVTFGNLAFAVSIADIGEDLRIGFEGGRTVRVASDWRPGRTLADFTLDGVSIAMKVTLLGPAIGLRRQGMDVVARVRRPRIAQLARLMPPKQPPDTSKTVLCPMPGSVTAVAVQAGDGVEIGQTLAVIEAMKMENLIKAERRGTVKRVAVRVGDGVSVDDLVLEFE